MEDVSFWRIGEEGRLERVWRIVARVLNAKTLLHSERATKVIMRTPQLKYEYVVTIEEDMPRRFKDLDHREALRLLSYQGRPTLVTISITPSFLPDSEKITLRNPFAVVKGYPGLVCISAISPGGTVYAVRQAALTPLRVSDMNGWLSRDEQGDGVGRMRPARHS